MAVERLINDDPFAASPRRRVAASLLSLASLVSVEGLLIFWFAASPIASFYLRFPVDKSLITFNRGVIALAVVLLMARAWTSPLQADRASRFTFTATKFEIAWAMVAAMTMHRPSNVDDRATLAGIVEAMAAIQERLPIIFPVHPRTRARLEEFGLMERVRQMQGLTLAEPLGYLDFLQLYSNSRLVLTDSGGIQEETTALGIPCLTLRRNTERPVTVSEGTNRLVGNDTEVIRREAFAALDHPSPRGRVPELWDGHAAVRIVDAIEEASRPDAEERRGNTATRRRGDKRT